MKKIFATLIMATLISFTFAGNGNDEKKNDTSSQPVQSMNISGQVIDFETGEALTGVEIILEGTSEKVFTDFDGNFLFSELQPGEYNIVASFISYKNSLVENLNENQNKIEIKLQSED